MVRWMMGLFIESIGFVKELYDGIFVMEVGYWFPIF